MKKTCKRCKALEIESEDVKCLMGYKIEAIITISGKPLLIKPLEKCLKPLTYNKLYQFMRMNNYQPFGGINENYKV